ncbi:ethanolamine ammonia-lyase reactivating factor EutA [Hungatella sp.]
MAKALGQLLRQRFSNERNIVVIDEICVEDNNFVDFGKP